MYYRTKYKIPGLRASRFSNPFGITKLKSVTILIVDDEPLIRLLVRDFTKHSLRETCDVDFLEASNIAEAYETIKNNHIDLVVTDNRMPGGHGTELIGYMKAFYSDIPAILMSGDQREPEHQADGFVPKPIDFDLLGQLISELLKLSPN